MNKAWFVISLVLLAVAGSLYWLLATEKKSTAALQREVVAVRAQAATAQVTNAALQELSRAHIERLNAGLTNTIRQLVTAQGRIRELELRPAVPLPATETNPPPAPLVEAVPLAQAVTVTTNTVGMPQRQIVVSGVYTTKGGLLGTNLEYTGAYGRRVAFKEPASGRRMAYDVDQLHPTVLAALGIDPEVQRQLQARQEQAWKRMETASLAQAAADAERRRERAAALAQAREQALQAPPADGVSPNVPAEQPGSANPAPNPALPPR
jgi:hypothetical protein